MVAFTLKTVNPSGRTRENVCGVGDGNIAILTEIYCAVCSLQSANVTHCTDEIYGKYEPIAKPTKW